MVLKWKQQHYSEQVRQEILSTDTLVEITLKVQYIILLDNFFRLFPLHSFVTTTPVRIAQTWHRGDGCEWICIRHVARVGEFVQAIANELRV